MKLNTEYKRALKHGKLHDLRMNKLKYKRIYETGVSSGFCFILAILIVLIAMIIN